MNPAYTAIIQQDGDWWIGWVEEIPGVNSQGKTRSELMENLRSALQEALEMNRAKPCPRQRATLKRRGFKRETARVPCTS